MQSEQGIAEIEGYIFCYPRNTRRLHFLLPAQYAKVTFFATQGYTFCYPVLGLKVTLFATQKLHFLLPTKLQFSYSKVTVFRLKVTVFPTLAFLFKQYSLK